MKCWVVELSVVELLCRQTWYCAALAAAAGQPAGGDGGQDLVVAQLLRGAAQLPLAGEARDGGGAGAGQVPVTGPEQRVAVQPARPGPGPPPALAPAGRGHGAEARASRAPGARLPPHHCKDTGLRLRTEGAEQRVRRVL